VDQASRVAFQNIDGSNSLATNSIGETSLAEDFTIFDKSLQSGNYVEGYSGWKITGAGDAEFGNVVVRGDINASSGTIGYWNISTPAVSRVIGTKTLLGTFLESSAAGSNDIDVATGTYVGLYKSYSPDPIVLTKKARTSNVATLTSAGHEFIVGDKITVNIEDVGDITFNNNGSVVTVTAITTDTFSYANSGSTVSETDTIGEAELYNPDVAGLYLRDYTKSEFDYGYFSSEGIKYVSAEDVNILENPSFEYINSSAVITSDLTSWTAGTGLTLASQNFIDTSTDPDRYAYDAYSKFGGKLTWTSTVSTKLSAKLDWGVGSTYKIYENGRTLYFGLTAFPYYNTLTAGGAFSSANKASLSGTFTSAVATTTTVTYTGTGLTFVAGQILTVTGFTGGNATRFNVASATITSATSTQVVITVAGTAGTSTGTGSAIVGLLRLDFATAHNLTAGMRAYVGFNLANADPAFGGDITFYYISDVTTGSTFDVLASPAPTSTSIYISAVKAYSEIIEANFEYESLTSAAGGTITDQEVYEGRDLALDLSEVKIRFPNNQTVNLYDVLTVESKAEWDAASKNKYLLSASNTYMREFIDDTASVSAMSGTSVVKIDADVLLDKYSNLDPTNLALDADVFIDFPGWLYKFTGTTAAPVVSATKVANSGYILDDVYVSTSNKAFYGGSLSTVRWYATTDDVPSYSTAQASIEDPKDWISIDLDTQAAYLNYFNYITFRPTSYTRQLYSPPSLGTTETTISAIPLVPDQNIQTTTLSSGKNQSVNIDGTNYRSYEGFVKTTVGSDYSSSELQSINNTINTSGVVTNSRIAAMGVANYQDYTRGYIFADQLFVSAYEDEAFYEIFVYSGNVKIGSLLNTTDLTVSGTGVFDDDLFSATRVYAPLFEGQKIRLTPAVDLNTTSTDHNFQIGADSTINLRMDNNEIEVLNNGVGSTLNLNVAGSGTVVFGGLIDSIDTYSNEITTTRRAVWISSGGEFGYQLSTRTKKQDIAAANLNVDSILSIEPKKFRYIKAVEELGSDAPVEVGMIAEDLHDAGLTDFVDYGSSGDVEGIHYSNYVVALQAVARDQAAKIAALTDRLDILEGN
jgi:hypothetical protein